MKKLILLNSLILVISVLFSTPKALAEATAVQTLYSSVPSAVAISKNEVNTQGNIDPVSGNILNDLQTSFNLNINSSEGETKSYDFYFYSKIKTIDGEESAFGPNGVILFGNTTSLPTVTAVNNAKNGIAGNVDVIGYYVKMEPSSSNDMTVEYTSTQDYLECYKVGFQNGATSGIINQTINGSAATNTYLIGEDSSGPYSVTVYVTALQKL